MKTKKLSLIAILVSAFCVFGALFTVNYAKTVKADDKAVITADLEFKGGAAARIADNWGLRFIVYANEKVVNLVKSGGDAGMIIVPESVLKGHNGEDYFTYFKTVYGKEKEQISTPFFEKYLKVIDNRQAFTCSIVGIVDEHIAEKFVAIAYMVEGGVTKYSVRSDSRSVDFVVSAALEKADDTDYASVLAVASAINETLSKSGVANQSPLTVEGSVVDGLDLAKYSRNKTITAVTCGETAVGVEGSKATFTFDTHKELAGADAKLLTVTFSDKTSVKVNALLWTKFVSTEADLKSLQQYTYGNSEKVGYFKLTDDIVLTEQLSNETAITAAGNIFCGVLDGDNHKVSGFVLTQESERGLLGGTSAKTFVRNLKLDGTISLFSGGKGGLLAFNSAGGTFENIEAYISITSHGYAKEDNDSNGSGGLLGTNNHATYATQDEYNLANVTFKAKDAATAGYEYNCAMLYAPRTSGQWLEGKINLTNVQFIGFQDLIITNNGESNQTYRRLQTKEDLEDYCKTCEGVSVYSTLAAYNDHLLESAEKLNAADVDARKQYSVSTLVPKEISKVTLNDLDGEAILVEEGKITFVKSQTSDKAQKLIIQTTDGKIYVQEVTIWNILVSTEEDWKNINSSLMQVTNESGALTDYSGYIKLLNDITVTEAVTAANRNQYVIGYGDNLNPQGRKPLVLEGNGKTVRGWQSNYQLCSLVYASNAGTVVRNITVEASINATDTRKGVIVSNMSGGTFENITVTVTMPANTAGQSVAVFGYAYQLYYATDSATIKNVVIKSANEEVTGADDCLNAALYWGGTDYDNQKSKITLEKITVVGFKNIITFGAVEGITTVDALTEHLGADKVKEVIMYKTNAEYEAAPAAPQA